MRLTESFADAGLAAVTVRFDQRTEPTASALRFRTVCQTQKPKDRCSTVRISFFLSVGMGDEGRGAERGRERRGGRERMRERGGRRDREGRRERGEGERR